jgi:hypothetical protein
VLPSRPGHIRIHRLVQLVLQDGDVAYDGLEAIVPVVCGYECWNERTQADIDRTRILLPHCAHLIDHITKPLDLDQAQWLSKHSDLIVCTGNAYGALGQPGKQQELLERALRIQEAHFGLDHYQVAITLTSLGIAYGDLGQPGKQQTAGTGPSHPGGALRAGSL